METKPRQFDKLLFFIGQLNIIAGFLIKKRNFIPYRYVMKIIKADLRTFSIAAIAVLGSTMMVV